jgi:SAM-dependent methyltransferase
MITTAPNPIQVDVVQLERDVKSMYRDVALAPEREYHFEMGRALAERLGYAPPDLDAIPGAAIDSFAGVGYYFDLAALQPGEAVTDLGSGSGMDSFIAALKVGAEGRVIGVDMTDDQRAKAERLADRDGFSNVSYVKGYIEDVPLAAASADVVISNGVINLTPDKVQAMREVWRVLKPGGRFQIADIIVHKEVPQDSKDDIDLWSG